MTERLTGGETYLFGVDYEVAHDRINNEIGYHTNAARTEGHDSPAGQRHMALAKCYAQLRRSVRPDDPAGLEILSIALDAAQLSRYENQAIDSDTENHYVASA
ncbi:MAG: hypothetical protein LBH87_01320 [Coriobacteriales bacterium]|jgi:hypothetical protein|nr:hypothetical protein [Coriobacteriales bacterium]